MKYLSWPAGCVVFLTRFVFLELKPPAWGFERFGLLDDFATLGFFFSLGLARLPKLTEGCALLRPAVTDRVTWPEITFFIKERLSAPLRSLAVSQR